MNDEIYPTFDHLNDPYVMQLIETIARLSDEVERLQEQVVLQRDLISRAERVAREIMEAHDEGKP